MSKNAGDRGDRFTYFVGLVGFCCTSSSDSDEELSEDVSPVAKKRDISKVNAL